MDFYRGASRGSRGGYRGSTRGSFRGSSSTSRGSFRGSSHGNYGGGSRGGHALSSASYASSKYEHSPMKYSSSLEARPQDRNDDSYRRTVGHRSIIDSSVSRKRIRSEDAFNSSQSSIKRSHSSEEYRRIGRGGISSTSSAAPRYSDHSSNLSRNASYDESRAAKRPRTSGDFKSSTDSFRPPPPPSSARRPLRGRGGRGAPRGNRRESAPQRRSSSSRIYSRDETATTSEILAIRRAKLLRNRVESEKKALEDKEKFKASESGEKEKDDKGENLSEIKDAGKDEDKDSIYPTTFFGKPYIKLQCPLCDAKTLTFREYMSHLQESSHVKAIKEREEKIQKELTELRLEMKEWQKKADEDDLTSMNTSPISCSICKVSYTQDREKHQASELHLKLKSILLPRCDDCRIDFQSAMTYESHMCSLDHIRRKQLIELRQKQLSDKQSMENLDNLVVLDSVGSGDENEGKEETTKSVKGDKEVETEEDGENLNLGIEFIRTVRVKYCEVCRMYLPRSRDEETVLKRHCRTKSHLRYYLYHGNDELLHRIQAEDNEADKLKLKEEPLENPSESASTTHEDENTEDNNDDETGIEHDEEDIETEGAEEGVEGEEEYEEEAAEEDVNGEGEELGEEEEGHEAEGNAEGEVEGEDTLLWENVSEELKEEDKSEDEDDEIGQRFDRFSSNQNTSQKRENGQASLQTEEKKITTKRKVVSKPKKATEEKVK